MSTNTIGDEYPDGYDSSAAVLTDLETMIGVVASVARRFRDRSATIHGQLRGHGRVVPAEWVILIDGVQHPVSVVPVDGGHDVTTDDRLLEVRSDWEFGQHLFSGTINGRPVYVQFGRHGQLYRLSFDGVSRGVQVLKPREAELMQYIPERVPPDTSKLVQAPMPGLLISVAVQEGDEVKAGEELAVLEAMKMENTLRAERNGTVAKVHHEAGASLEVDQVIMELE